MRIQDLNNLRNIIPWNCESKRPKGRMVQCEERPIDTRNLEILRRVGYSLDRLPVERLLP
jgi:hypothetical protein